jgi:hypothetical protein
MIHYPHEIRLLNTSDEYFKYFFWAVLLNPVLGALRIQRYLENTYGFSYPEITFDPNYPESLSTIDAGIVAHKDILFIKKIAELEAKIPQECEDVLKTMSLKQNTFPDILHVISTLDSAVDPNALHAIHDTWRVILEEK